MGVGGLFYRSTLPSDSRPVSQPTLPATFEHPDTVAPMEAIASGSVSQMVDSSSVGLLSELNHKKKRIRTWPLAACLSGALLCALAALGASAWIIAPVAVLCLVGVFCAYQLDLLSKSVVIMYHFDSEMESAYQRLHDAVSQIARCGGKWYIGTRGDVYDRKYHAGASELVNRGRISVSTGEPPYVRTNISTPVIFLGARTLYFFPERLLVFARDGVGAVSYEDLSVVANDKRFIEEKSVPRDAQVVDQTWRYVNKSGGPDRRFNNNPQLPICLYEELWLNSPSGLNEVIQFSRRGIGEQLNAALEKLGEMLAQAAAKPALPLRSVESRRIIRSTPASGDLETHEQSGAASVPIEPQSTDRPLKSIAFLQGASPDSADHAFKIVERFGSLLKTEVDAFGGSHSLQEIEALVNQLARVPAVVRSFVKRVPALKPAEGKILKAVNHLVSGYFSQLRTTIEQVERKSEKAQRLLTLVCDAEKLLRRNGKGTS
jgi:hypothetical protein